MSEPLNPVDRSAVELLAAARQAAEQEITDKAQAYHEKLLLSDRATTLIGQLGLEAVGLYSDFTNREEFFMRRLAGLLKPSLSSKRGIRRYAGFIMESSDREMSMDTATKLARRRLADQMSLERQNAMLQRITIKGRSFSGSSVRKKTGWGFTSPALIAVDPEIIEGEQVAQQWRVESDEPFTTGLHVTTFHEFPATEHAKRKITYLHSLSVDEDGRNCRVTEQGRELEEDKLYFPLGLVVAAREAVRASVPPRVSKKW